MQLPSRIAVYSDDGLTLVGHYAARFVGQLLRAGRAKVTETKKVRSVGSDGKKAKQTFIKAVQLLAMTHKPSLKELAVQKGSFGIETVHASGFVYFQHQQRLYDGLAA